MKNFYSKFFYDVQQNARLNIIIQKVFHYYTLNIIFTHPNQKKNHKKKSKKKS